MDHDGVGTWIRRRAISSAGHPALIFRDEAIPYERLAARIDAVAHVLRARDVGAGDRVAFLGNNHPAFIETMLATALVGAVFVPLNTRLTPGELAYMIDDSGARLLVSTAPLEAVAAETASATAVPRLIVADGEDGGPHDYETAITADGMGRGEAEPAGIGLDDPALIIYTSGTTGRPKGAVLTHGNLTWNAVNVLVDYDVLSTDRALMISPLFHVASLGMGCLPVLLKGATVLLEERFVPGDALRSIERLRATMISGVPTTYQLMLDDEAWDTADISSLRVMTCGGSAMPDRVRVAYDERGLAFTGGYGMTEAAPGVTMLPARFSGDHGASVGLPHFFTRFRLSGDPAPGETGEVEVRGPNVFAGYWGNPDQSAAVLAADGWLRTGDMGVVDADGFLTIADRAKDMIISGGENIYSAEVEQAILAIPGVTGVAVIGRPDERWGEVPHAVVTLAPGQTLDAARLAAELDGRLARYKVPRTLDVVADLPRTASGKVQKHLLRTMADDA